ncbi:MAG: hypothetical protein JW846_06675 [Dehalococcoidia bacterium]|nr:hypothetical protein [Dehalococcoidia bacterium]
MTSTVEEPQKEPKEEPQKEPQDKKSGKSQRKTAIIVGLVCVGVVAAVVAMNSDRLSVHSAASTPTGQQVEATTTPNTAPVILSVTPATDRIQPLDQCQVICEAEDDDGDTLTYAWTTGQGDISGEGATVEWAAPDTEGIFRVSVTVDDGNGGTAEFSTSLRVKNNYAPEIQSLTAFDEWVLPGASTYVSSSATDADGDAVTFEWDATAGEIIGEGDSIIWIAPAEEGSYRVTVRVLDSYGGEESREVPISVTQGTAPELGRFVVKPINHGMLDFKDGVWDIFQGRSCTVKCMVVEGEEPFTYTWTTDWGTLTAEGDIATWEAPIGKGPATITVDVTDVNGNTTTGTVLMYVETCTCRF